jgi:hypothetical protein
MPVFRRRAHRRAARNTSPTVLRAKVTAHLSRVKNIFKVKLAHAERKI